MNAHELASLCDRLSMDTDEEVVIELPDERRFTVDGGKATLEGSTYVPVIHAEREVTKTEPDRELDELYDRLTKMEDGFLDDLVHDAASDMGSDVNNDGLGRQLQFLVEQYTRDGAISEIAERLRLEEPDDEEE